MSATVKQLETIDGLVGELGYEGELRDNIYAIARAADARPGQEVSQLISGLITQAQRKRAAARPAAAAADMDPRGMWADVPDGRYALTHAQAAAHSLDHLIAGERDTLFVRVSTWTPPGRREPLTFVRQIKGGVGDWTKIKHSAGINRDIKDALLAVGPVDAGRLFSELHTVCARCLSPLTDQRSRETGYGPDCREIMGLAR